jgi:hypothetical protein
VIARPQLVGAHSEQLPDGIVERKKSLSVTSGFESAHVPLPLASRLMRDFGSIVGVSVHSLSHVAEDASHGRSSSAVCRYNPQWFGALAAQESSKESLCGTLITIRLDQDVDHVAILIDNPPQIPLLAVDSNEDLIQVPVVTEPSLTSLQFPSIAGTELLDTTAGSHETMIPLRREDPPRLGNSDRTDSRSKETGRSSWQECFSSCPVDNALFAKSVGTPKLSRTVDPQKANLDAVTLTLPTAFDINRLGQITG